MCEGVGRVRRRSGRLCVKGLAVYDVVSVRLCLREMAVYDIMSVGLCAMLRDLYN